MVINNYLNELKRIDDYILSLTEEKRKIKEELYLAILEHNGYKIGDVVMDKKNNPCIIMGVNEIGNRLYYLDCRKQKKDDTASSIPGAYLEYKLNID